MKNELKKSCWMEGWLDLRGRRSRPLPSATAFSRLDSRALTWETQINGCTLNNVGLNSQGL